MKTTTNTTAKKRPVNLSLNEDLVNQVRGLTDNLSGVVESLLTDYVDHQRQVRMAKANALEATISMWNSFDAKHGSFADEYSPL